MPPLEHFRAIRALRTARGDGRAGGATRSAPQKRLRTVSAAIMVELGVKVAIGAHSPFLVPWRSATTWWVTVWTWVGCKDGREGFVESKMGMGAGHSSGRKKLRRLGVRAGIPALPPYSALTSHPPQSQFHAKIFWPCVCAFLFLPRRSCMVKGSRCRVLLPNVAKPL